MARAPSPGAPAWEHQLDRRLRSVLESIPGYASLRPRGAPGAALPDEETPSWLRIPIWLDESWPDRRGGPVPADVLGEVLWGQYALFLFIRLQDDVLDGSRDDLRLIVVADRFLLESLAGFQRFPDLDQGFWTFYRSCLRDTVDAALEVGRLEKAPGAFRAEDLGLHARVSAILKVGTAALCRLRGRAEDAGWVARLQDRLAIVSQITDDLDDLAEDLADGRYTWVGNTILAARPGECLTPDERASRLGAGLLRPERGAAVAEELRRAVVAAAAELPASAPAELDAFVRGLGRTPDELERCLHEARVRWVFGDVLAGVPHDAGGTS